ncbi:transglutaminase family protein [Methylocystis parvus]|uniref:transglutaminase family protein n=1 Tax=Methylocystis parvus TaxID=134 RepID=UPI003C73CB43
MIYDIEHVTTYSYEASVASTRCAIRLTPRESRGQRVLRSRVEAAPAPEATRESMDFFGNRVVEAMIREAHARLRISVSARVEVAREEPPAACLTPSWENVARAAGAARTLSRESPVHWLFPSRQAPLHAPVTDYARESFQQGRPVLEAAEELMRRIKADFAYDPNATHVATPLADAFAARGGVCQDFAHIMIAGLRGLSLPAAYVSGYIRTAPPPGQPHLEGADASHAWVAVWCGEPFGWIHLDPTNAMYADDNHIVVAIGRDYADVSPIDGVIVGAGRQALGVSVDIRAVGGAQ